MFEILIALLGFPLGFILTLIAPEELKDGKRYFLILKHTFFALLILTAVVLLLYTGHYSFLALPVLYPVLYCFLHHQKLLSAEAFNYAFFLLLYFSLYYLHAPYLIIFSSLVFLYGLPAGTLLKDVPKRS